jgi:hypothetical protein
MVVATQLAVAEGLFPSLEEDRESGPNEVVPISPTLSLCAGEEVGRPGELNGDEGDPGSVLGKARYVRH